jgi:uncharacterized linocin/CFP29 family protein
MNHLHRELAPLDDDAWAQVDEDAKSRLVTYLAGRRLIDFVGPLGWKHSSVGLGRVAPVDGSPAPGVEVALRQVLPLAEVRVPFTLSRAALDEAARGNVAIDLTQLDEAALTLATCENVSIFHGWPEGGIHGMTDVSSHEVVAIEGEDATAYPRAVATAVERLSKSGIRGPYALALGDESWVRVVGSTERGSTLLSHLSTILEAGPIIWSPGVAGAVVVSQRGGDFEFTSGQDLSIGYRSADAESVVLYLEESFTFRVLEPDAAIALRGVS